MLKCNYFYKGQLHLLMQSLLLNVLILLCLGLYTMIWVENAISTIMRNSQSACSFLVKCSSQDQVEQYTWNSVPWVLVKFEFVHKM